MARCELMKMVLEWYIERGRKLQEPKVEYLRDFFCGARSGRLLSSVNESEKLDRILLLITAEINVLLPWRYNESANGSFEKWIVAELETR